MKLKIFTNFLILISVFGYLLKREQLLPRHGLFPSKKELYDHDFLQQPIATKLQITIVVMEMCQKNLYEDENIFQFSHFDQCVWICSKKRTVTSSSRTFPLKKRAL